MRCIFDRLPDFDLVFQAVLRLDCLADSLREDLVFRRALLDPIALEVAQRDRDLAFLVGHARAQSTRTRCPPRLPRALIEASFASRAFSMLELFVEGLVVFLGRLLHGGLLSGELDYRGAQLIDRLDAALQELLIQEPHLFGIVRLEAQVLVVDGRENGLQPLQFARGRGDRLLVGHAVIQLRLAAFHADTESAREVRVLLLLLYEFELLLERVARGIRVLVKEVLPAVAGFLVHLVAEIKCGFEALISFDASAAHRHRGGRHCDGHITAYREEGRTHRGERALQADEPVDGIGDRERGLFCPARDRAVSAERIELALQAVRLLTGARHDAYHCLHRRNRLVDPLSHELLTLKLCGAPGLL
jgi:hypothetical protein